MGKVTRKYPEILRNQGSREVELKEISVGKKTILENLKRLKSNVPWTWNHALRVANR